MSNKIGVEGIKNVFPDRSFSGLTFKVHKSKDVLKDFPQLKDLPSWKSYTRADSDKVMKYVIYLFDPETPLRKERKEEDRRHAAALLAGFHRQDSEGYKRMVAMQDETLIEMVADYVSYIGNKEWTMLIVNELLFDRLVKSAMVDSMSVATKAPEEMEKVSQRIDTLNKKIFGDGKASERVRQQRVSPEVVARRQHSVQE